MTDGWSKFVRTDFQFHRVDQLNGRRVGDGTIFNVRFPSGKTTHMPCITRREVALTDQPPFMRIEERVYFSVAYEGLPQIWLRAIDVEVQPVPQLAQKKAAKKK